MQGVGFLNKSGANPRQMATGGILGVSRPSVLSFTSTEADTNSRRTFVATYKRCKMLPAANLEKPATPGSLSRKPKIVLWKN